MKKTIIFIFLIFGFISAYGFIGGMDETDQEVLMEEKLEGRINQLLDKIIADEEFLVFVDLKPFEFQDEISGLPGFKGADKYNIQLPGIVMPEEPSYEERRSDDFSDLAPNLKKYKKEISLFLFKDVPEEKINIIKIAIAKAAQMDNFRGDKLELKSVDFLPKQGAELIASNYYKGKKGGFWAANYWWLILVGALVFLTILFTIILIVVKSRSSKLQLQPAAQSMPATAASSQTTSGQQPEKKDSSGAPVKTGGTKDASSEDLSGVAKELAKQEVINLAFSRPELLGTIMNEWVKEDNGLRQAAYIVKSFGLETTMNLFSKVDTPTKSKIFGYYNSVDTWSVDEEIKALNKMKNVLIAQKFQQLSEEEGTKQDRFSFASKLSDYQLFYLVKDEDSPVIALLLAHLPPEKAAKLISSLPDDKRNKVIVELGNINFVNAEVLVAVTRRLAEKSLMIPKFDLHPGSGVNALISILDNVDEGTEKGMLDSIKLQDADLANKIKKAYFVFDDLLGLPVIFLKAIIKEVPKNALATALVGAKEEITKKILGVLPERKREMLNFDIEKSKNIAQTEVQKAQRYMVNKIRQMINSGEIDLDKAEEMKRKGIADKDDTQTGAAGPAQAGDAAKEEQSKDTKQSPSV